jgi:hypothetical protein
MAFPKIVEVEGTLMSWRAARPTNRGSRCKSRHAVARCRQAYATAQTAEAQAVVDAPIPVPGFHPGRHGPDHRCGQLRRRRML